MDIPLKKGPNDPLVYEQNDRSKKVQQINEILSNEKIKNKNSPLSFTFSASLIFEGVR